MSAGRRLIALLFLLTSPRLPAPEQLELDGWSIARVELNGVSGSRFTRAPDDSLERRHGAAVELVSPDLTSQSFWWPGGPLTVRLTLQGARVVKFSPTHATLETPRGLVRYGPVWLYAAGQPRVALQLTGEGHTLELHADATGPAVIDPWISAERDLDLPIPVSVGGGADVAARDGGWFVLHTEPSLVGGTRFIDVDLDGGQHTRPFEPGFTTFGSRSPDALLGGFSGVTGYVLLPDGGAGTVPCVGGNCAFAISSRSFVLVTSATDAGLPPYRITVQQFDGTAQPLTGEQQLGQTTENPIVRAAWHQGGYSAVWATGFGGPDASIMQRLVDEDGGVGPVVVTSAPGWLTLGTTGSPTALLHWGGVKLDGGTYEIRAAFPGAVPFRVSGPLDRPEAFFGALGDGFAATTYETNGTRFVSIGLDASVASLLALNDADGGFSAGPFATVGTRALYLPLRRAELGTSLYVAAQGLTLSGGSSLQFDHPLVVVDNDEVSPFIASSADRYLVGWFDTLGALSRLSLHPWAMTLSRDGTVLTGRTVLDPMSSYSHQSHQPHLAADAVPGWNVVVPTVASFEVFHVALDGGVDRLTSSTSFGTQVGLRISSEHGWSAVAYRTRPFSIGVFGMRFAPGGAPIESDRFLYGSASDLVGLATFRGEHLLFLRGASGGDTLDLSRWPVDGGPTGALERIGTPDASFICTGLECTPAGCLLMYGAPGPDVALYALDGGRVRSLGASANCPMLRSENDRFHVIEPVFDGGVFIRNEAQAYDVLGNPFGPPWSVFGSQIDLAGDRDGGAMLIYENKGQARVRSLNYLPTSAACMLDTDCLSGFCVDGVCCADSCGGADPTDCKACSASAGAPLDGQCNTVQMGRLCRAEANVCDDAERCDGMSSDCPVDPGPRPGCDAGQPPDAGVDAGTASPFDAGTPDRRDLAAACGCSGAGAAPLELGLLALLYNRRRPRSSVRPR